jgi:phospholipid transport system substrate-binding protein
VLKWLVWLWLPVWLASGATASTAAAGPLGQVQTTVEAILAVLKDGQQEAPARRAAIRTLVHGRFDFRAMSQGTLATHWRKATEAERDQFVELFSDLLEASYMAKIEAYTDERIEYVKERIDGNKATVDTVIVTKSVEIPIRYKLVDRAGDWRVYDVAIEDVSLVRNYRSTYGEIVNRDGFDGLLAQMRTKLADLKNAGEGSAP